VLLPEDLAPKRAEVLEMLRKRGVGVSTYFSPHLAEQTYFAKHAVCVPLSVTENVAGRILTLPMFDTMTESDVRHVATTLRQVVTELIAPREAVQLVARSSLQETIAAMAPSYRGGKALPDVPHGLGAANRA
jgi:hypothetical protein